jgi:hypothetical protein
LQFSTFWLDKLTCNVFATILEHTLVTLCCNLLAPACHLFSNSLSVRVSFSTSAASVHCRTLPGISFQNDFQNEFRDIFSDSPVPNKLTVLSAESFQWYRKLAGQNMFWLTFVVKWQEVGQYLSNSVVSLIKLLFRVDYPLEVNVSLQRFWNFICIMYMSCMNSRNLIRKNVLSISDGLHTSFSGFLTF